MSEEMQWVASRVFTDEHVGRAMTEEEVSRMLLLEDEYEDEIAMAKLMLKNNPDFVNLDFEKKLQVSEKVITSLREKKEEKSSKAK